MRMLTFSEAREIEHLKAEINEVRQYQGGEKVIVVTSAEADFWLNALEMVLQTNEALSLAWRKSPNPKTDIVELVRNSFDGR